MSINCIVERSFCYKGKESFDLSLVEIYFGQGNSRLYLIRSVTLPFPLLNQFYTLMDENEIMENGLYNYDYCHDLILTIASFILDSVHSFSNFFYPFNHLNKSNEVNEDFLNKYKAVKQEIKQKKYDVFAETNSEKVFCIQNVLSLIKLLGKKYYLRKKEISRTEFESFIQNTETGHAYVEIYNDLNSFTLIYSKKGKLPVCVIAFNKKKIKFGILTGVERISI
jgi:hypothetical protein